MNTNIISLKPQVIFTDFLKLYPSTGKAVRNPNNPLINFNPSYPNSCPGGIITDPLDSTKFLFYRGNFTGATTVGAIIDLFVASYSAPYDFSNHYGVVISPTPATDDANGTRFGSVLNVNGTIYYYYVGVDANYKWRIFLATSSDGRTFTKQGMVLDFNSVDEFSLSGPSVINNNGKWYMTYTVWDGAAGPVNHNPGYSKVGIKSAISADGINWTKTNTLIVPIGSAGAIDDEAVEDGQLMRIGSQWALFYNCASAPGWAGASVALAYGDRIDKVFTKHPTQILLPNSANTWEKNLVSVLNLHRVHGRWIGYYQGTGLSGSDAPIGAVTYN